MKQELEQKINQNCTFAPKIISKSKNAIRKKKYNASAFMKEGLSDYFHRLERAKKMKGKNSRRRTPPPLQREGKYESKLRPMQMQKTDQEFFNSSKEVIYGGNQSRNNNRVAMQSHALNNGSIQNKVLNDLSNQISLKEVSPPQSPHYSRTNQPPNTFAVHTKQLMQGLFSSNETGMVGLIGSSHRGIEKGLNSLQQSSKGGSPSRKSQASSRAEIRKYQNQIKESNGSYSNIHFNGEQFKKRRSNDRKQQSGWGRHEVACDDLIERLRDSKMKTGKISGKEFY